MDAERPPDGPYDDWVRRYDTLTDEDRQLIRAHIERLPARPLISVVMPAYETNEALLREAVASVRNQLYPFWELCVADDASPSGTVRAVLTEAAAADSRIRWVRRAVNGHISAATNSALELATGAFVALMDHDDLLPEHALYQVAAELGAHPDADVIYSDEDRVDLQGRRLEPYFKPAWSPELLTGHNLISHLGIFRRSLLEQLGGLRLGYEGSQDWDLALRATAATTPDRVRHIPAVLYHWRWDATAPSFSQTWLDRCRDAGRRAVQESLDREGCAGAELLPARYMPGWTRVAYALPDPVPMVSIVIPMREGFRLAGWTAATDWPGHRLEFVVVGSQPPAQGVRAVVTDRIVGQSEALNLGVAASRGDVVVLVAGDMEPVEKWWLKELVSQASRHEAGVVGAKLVDTEGLIVHGGVVLRDGGAAVIGRVMWNEGGYFGQYALTRALSAVAGGCIALRRDVFDDAGGLDPALEGTEAEVALCTSVRDLGYRVIWTPEAVLRYRPGRGPAANVDAVEGGRPLADPYHNPNLQLDPLALAIPSPPRRKQPWR